MENNAKTKYKAVLFDKDGVLIDSLDTCYLAFNETLKNYGKKEISKNKYKKEFWGIKAEVTLNKLFYNSSKNMIRKIVSHYLRERIEKENFTRLYSNVMPVINVLKNKYKLGVITNTDTDIAIKILKKFHILEYFDVVVGGDIINPKPSPDPIIKACNFFMIKPEETLFIGDTLTDIKAGKAAGCKTVIITTSKKRDEIEGIKDIIVFNDLIEILKIV